MEIPDKNLRDIAAITSDGLYDVPTLGTPTAPRSMTLIGKFNGGHAQHYTELVGIQTRNSE